MRCCAGTAETYDAEVRSNPAVQEAVAVLNGCLRTSEAKALLFQGPFHRFAQLWASDLPAALQASSEPCTLGTCLLTPSSAGRQTSKRGIEPKLAAASRSS